MIVYKHVFGQTLMNSLHGQLNWEIGGLDCVCVQSIKHVPIVYTWRIT